MQSCQCQLFQQIFLFLNIFSIDLTLFPVFNGGGGIFKILGKEGEPYMGGLNILLGDLRTP